MTKMFTLQKPLLSDGLETSLQWTHDRMFSGFVFDAADPGRTFVVELLIGGYPVKCGRAADYVDALAARGIGDGCYGFSFSLADDALHDEAVVEARIANLATAVGEPIVIRDGAAFGALLSSHGPAPGAVRWLGGLRFSGWLADGSEPIVDILVDGESVSQVRASGWAQIGDAEDARAVRAFDVHLPQQFADGSARRAAIMNLKGEHLEGSPVSFVASFETNNRTGGNPAAAHMEALGAGMVDRAVPMSIPFAHYRAWRRHLTEPTADGDGLKAAVILVGTGDTDATLKSLEAQCHPDWVAASLPETADFAGFHIDAAREFLAGDAAEAEFVIFLLAGARLTAAALTRISRAFTRSERADAVYGDVDIAAADASLWPMAFPAFDYERMLEQGYCGHVFALRRAAAQRVIAGGAGNLYRVFNSFLDDGSKSTENIVHLPGAIATLPSIDLDAAARALASATQDHLKQRGADALVTPHRGCVLPAVRIARRSGEARVTVVIPTRNRRELLEACLASIEPARRKREFEIIVVDNESSDPDALDHLSSIDGRHTKVVRAAGDLNMARLYNLASARAEGDYLCLLNHHVRALDDEWLEEMLGRMGTTDVGAVGALLSWPSGVVQNGGVVLGPNFATVTAFGDCMDEDAGYCDSLRVAHERSAVTACLLTRRKDYNRLGGMDELRFPARFHDVDYCLKLRAAGKRVVFTPHARLRHRAPINEVAGGAAAGSARSDRELRNLRAKWADVLTADPFYNPALSLDLMPFSALAWPQRSMDARTSAPPIPVNVPPGF
jgi:O-antigen biosynthesis protein